MCGAPHFGRIGKNIFYAQGFSGHGVALTGLAGKLIAESVAGTSERFDLFSRIPHLSFPGGRYLRMPALVLAMAYYRIRDLLPWNNFPGMLKYFENRSAKPVSLNFLGIDTFDFDFDFIKKGFLAAIAWSTFSLLEYNVITEVFGPVRVQINTSASGKFEGALTC